VLATYGVVDDQFDDGNAVEPRRFVHARQGRLSGSAGHVAQALSEVAVRRLGTAERLSYRRFGPSNT
jgi:hypothetical protein